MEHQLAILGDASSSAKLRERAESDLFTALGGGYEPEMRLRIAGGLIGRVDVAFHSLLAKHLEDIRTEAKELGNEDLLKEAERLLKSLKPSKKSKE